MVTIRYNLTPEDYAALEADRWGGLVGRILRIPAGALIGGMGLILTWQAIFFFPWSHSARNLALAGMGLVFLWIGLGLPGSKWLSLKFSDPYAVCEVQVFEGKLVSFVGGKTQQFRWFPRRGFKENDKFFLLRAFDANFAIPKRAVTPAQEKELRELVRPESVLPKADGGDAIECSFYLTQDEMNEASTPQGWFQRWLRTRYGRLCARAICGSGALWILWFLWFPLHSAKPWAEFRNEPGVAAGLLAYALFMFFVAAGCPGLKSLNRLDLQRRIRLSNLAVEIARGTKTSIYPWKRFFSYHETQNLFLLRTQITVRFWTIPKRALRSGDEEKLRALLDRKMPAQ
jgi:hypothetical protein